MREEAVASANQFVRDSRNRMEAGTFAEVDVARAKRSCRGGKGIYPSPVYWSGNRKL